MGVVFFDMDKTLTRVLSAIILGEHIGKQLEIAGLEESMGVKEITSEEWVIGIGELIKGYTLAHLREVYEKLPLIDGIPESLEYLKDRELRTLIITAGVGEFAKFLQEDYGFDFYHGCTTVMKDGSIAGLGPPIITAERKAEYIEQFCSRLGINPKDCFAVGDSRTDIPMFHAVGTSIAINYTDVVQGHATHYIRPCHNLTEILEHIP